MANNFSAHRGPKWHHGDESDPTLVPRTSTASSRYVNVDVLPGETLADLTKRVYGTNSELNRRRIQSLNPKLEGTVRVYRPR